MILSDWYFTRTSNRIVADIRKEVFSHLLKVRMDFYSKNKSGELVHKINNEIDKIQHVLTNSIVRFINNSFQIIGLIILLCSLNFKLFAISIIIFPLIIFTTRYFAPKLRKTYEDLSDKQANLTNFFKERFHNIRLIRSANSYQFEVDGLSNNLKRLNEVTDRSSLQSSLSRNISTFLIAMGPVIVFGWGGSMVLMQSLSLGSLVAFLQYLNRLYNPALDLFYLYDDIVRATVSMDQIIKLLDEPAQELHGLSLSNESHLRNIIFRDVNFSFPGKNVLSNFNVVFERGKKYAIVGGSGSGKSTIVNLICRLYDPQSGYILADQRKPLTHPIF